MQVSYLHMHELYAVQYWKYLTSTNVCSTALEFFVTMYNSNR